VWLSQVADGVDPRPEIDVRDWPAVSERGNVGVVWIPPVAEPPAIVKDGTIYHRVAGSSRPVTDGRLLAELFRRGDAARELAVAAASGVLGFLGMNSETYANFAFAGTGGPRGFASPLFTAGAVKAIESAATAAFPGAGLRRPAQVDVFSRFVHVTVETLGSGTKLVVVASRFGAVGIQFVAPPNTSGNGPSLIVGHEWPSVAWRTGLKVLEALKATGRLYVAIGINMRLGMPGSVGRTDPDFRDWVALGPPEAAELARITREIRRLGGEAVLDPDPVAAGAEQPDERSVDRAPGLDRLT
jgi:hypothetical protein